MNKHDVERRELLRLLAALPVGLTVGCDWNGDEVGVSGDLLGPEDSLKRLILVLGPWSEEERRRAESFADRFIAAPHAGGALLADAAEELRSLAARFGADGMQVAEIRVEELSESESEVLLALVKQLYSLVEVRFLVSGEPAWGECQDDPLMHTRAPVSG
jgi:hypothetical protein